MVIGSCCGAVGQARLRLSADQQVLEIVTFLGERRADRLFSIAAQTLYGADERVWPRGKRVRMEL